MHRYSHLQTKDCFRWALTDPSSSTGDKADISSASKRGNCSKLKKPLRSCCWMSVTAGKQMCGVNATPAGKQGGRITGQPRKARSLPTPLFFLRSKAFTQKKSEHVVLSLKKWFSFLPSAPVTYAQGVARFQGMNLPSCKPWVQRQPDCQAHVAPFSSKVGNSGDSRLSDSHTPKLCLFSAFLLSLRQSSVRSGAFGESSPKGECQPDQQHLVWDFQLFQVTSKLLFTF